MVLNQLVWKPEPVDHSVCGKTTRVSSNKNDTTAAKPPEFAPKRKRISPSRVRRNARRLQAFLKKQDLLQSVDSHVSQREFEHADNLVVASATDDKDLKSYIDKEVSCVDFLIDNGEPGLELELNSGEYVWAPVCVKKPGGNHSLLKILVIWMRLFFKVMRLMTIQE